MKSENRLFSKTVFKSDLKRFLPFSALLLIIQLIIFPITIYYNYSPKDNLTTETLAAAHSTVSSVFTFIFAAVMALLVFSYLYSPNKCNALHAFPLGRKKLYATGFLSGYLLLVLPQIIGFVPAIPIIMRLSSTAGEILALQTVSIFAESFVYYAIAALAVMLAGNIFAGAVIYGIINFLYFALSTALDSAVSGFGYGLRGNDYKLPFGNYFSPPIQLMGRKISMNYAEGYRTAKDYYVSVAILAAAAVLIAVLAYLLYKARELECAGDMVAFGVEIPIFSTVAAVVGGAATAIVISAMFSFGKGAMLCAYALLSPLFFLAAQMVLRKSARVFTLKSFALWAVIFAVSAGAALGLARFETKYIPKADEVESLTFNSTYNIKLSEKPELEKARELQELIIKKEKTNDSRRESGYEYYSEEEAALNSVFNFNYTYKLKNGREITRNYLIYDRDEELLSRLDDMEAAHQPKTVFEQLESVGFVIKSCTVNDNSVFEDDGSYLSEVLERDESETLWSLCAEDAKAAATDYRTSSTAYTDTIGRFEISFECAVNSEEDRELVENICYDASNIGSVSIYFDGDVTPDGPKSDSFTVYVSGLTNASRAKDFLERRQ